MSRLELQVSWLPAPAAEDAFGPERVTWAELQLRLDGDCLTQNHPADSRGDDVPTVVGGMSGLAEWIVDAWLPIHFETHTPFAKVLTLQTEGSFPSLRDALQGWSQFIAAEAPVSGGELGAWQQRHTFGAARSDLALPSIVLVPEGPWVGIALDHLPDRLRPTVRFTAPRAPGGWPAPPVWLPMWDVSEALARFVNEVIDRARSDSAFAQWAGWLDTRWTAAREQARDPEVVRRWRFGALTSSRWAALETRLQTTMPALEGLLVDAPTVRDEPALDALAGLVLAGGGAGALAIPADLQDVDWGLPHHVEGYRLAQRFRSHHGLMDQPLDDARLTDVVGQLGVEVREIEARGLFKSAVWTAGGGGVIGWATDDPVLATPAPRRFAVAAALGRLLVGGAEGTVRGAAHGRHSRLRPTQLANAFAAELLLPIQAFRPGADLQALSKEYGISGTAAAWHRHNRLPELEA